PWNSLLNDTTSGDSCIKKQSTPALPGLAGGSASQNANGGAAVTTTGSSSAAGSCTAPSGGDCSVSNLSTTCFGSNASQAAQICNKESANNPNNLSRSDVTSDGHSYSVGLFQINITNSFNQQVDGQNCSAAFSGPCQGKNVVQSGSTAGHCSVTVTNTQLYNDCVTAAENPTNNINAACSLNNDGNSGWSKWSTSSACNL
ncbi:MAG: hypothetical protein P4M11_11590, partial [Candidatus Pacebacteria bacterium]|nr:hypothetical protein [Candidatus Paceibacterota bacterium]